MTKESTPMATLGYLTDGLASIPDSLRTAPPARGGAARRAATKESPLSWEPCAQGARRRPPRRRAMATVAAVVAVLAMVASVAAAAAQAASPQWTVTAVSRPTNFAPGSQTAGYRVTVTNTGSAASDGTPVTISDELPSGLTLGASGASGEDLLGPVSSPPTPATAGFECALRSCTYHAAVVPDQTVEFTLPVEVSTGPFTDTCPVSSGAIACLTNVVRVSGGGASAASMQTPTLVSREPARFGIAPGGATTALSSVQAGAHPDITNSLALNTVDPEGALAGDPKDVTFDLPPGFAGDLVDTPVCAPAQFGPVECPIATQVGVAAITLVGESIAGNHIEPVYNIAPNPGQVSRLGFPFPTTAGIEGGLSVRRSDYGIRAVFENTNQFAVELSSISLTVWGIPADPVHNPLRFLKTPGSPGEIGIFGAPSGAARAPFFTNPTSCGTQPLVSSFDVDSWQEPDGGESQTMSFGPIVGCDRLTIEPTIATTPTSTSAESATGLGVNLRSPQSYENPDGLVASHLDLVRVTLPEGMTLNPSAGSGLGSCSAARFAYEGGTAEPLPGFGCPNESKIGQVKVHSPALTEEASGSLYVARPFENPFNSLLALYLVARIPDRGVVVTAAGNVHADPTTGQLTTTFSENPQLPFDQFTLAFRQGATSPLVTPPTCGTFSTAALLTPWSVPTQEHLLSSTFGITSGVDGGPCPSGATPPFHPGLEAGTTNNQAGSFSPFYLRLSRQDGEQEITHFSIKLPPGLLAGLAGVAKCSDAAIAQAKSREHEQGGTQEETSPSCPTSSEVGHTLVEAGVGSILAQAPGHVYLAGPYHGAPISLVSITAAKVGPFDLGTVVVRFALKVNPETTEVSVDGQDSDPIPHIIDGIAVHLRNIRTYVDRNHFTLNPTSCTPTSTASTVVGSGNDFVSSSDDQPVTVTSRFQAAGCASLGFKPKLKLQLKGGKTSRGGLPGLKATLTARPGDANIGRAQVTLPPSEFLEQGHLKDVCPRSVWVQGSVPGEKCPARSIYGHARATTPLLSEPLEGPVYLRTGYGTKLPQLVAALNAQEINVDVVGEIDSVHQKGSEVALLRNTFKTVPDAPVTKFELELKGGKKGLLVNSQNVCKGTHKALAAFTGQNGKLSETEPTLIAPCKRSKKGKKGHAKKGGGKKGPQAGGKGH